MPHVNFVEFREYSGYSRMYRMCRNRVFPVNHIESHARRTLSDFLEITTMPTSGQDRVTHIPE